MTSQPGSESSPQTSSCAAARTQMSGLTRCRRSRSAFVVLILISGSSVATVMLRGHCCRLRFEKNPGGRFGSPHPNISDRGTSSTRKANGSLSKMSSESSFIERTKRDCHFPKIPRVRAADSLTFSIAEASPKTISAFGRLDVLGVGCGVLRGRPAGYE